MKFTFSVSTRYAGSECVDEYEVEDTELEGMTPEEIEDYVNEHHFRPWMFEQLDAYFERVDEGAP